MKHETSVWVIEGAGVIIVRRKPAPTPETAPAPRRMQANPDSIYAHHSSEHDWCRFCDGEHCQPAPPQATEGTKAP